MQAAHRSALQTTLSGSLLAGDDVRDGQPPTGSEHSRSLGEDPLLSAGRLMTPLEITTSKVRRRTGAPRWTRC